MLWLTWCGEQRAPEVTGKTGHFTYNRGVPHDIERRTVQKLALTHGLFYGPQEQIPCTKQHKGVITGTISVLQKFFNYSQGKILKVFVYSEVKIGKTEEKGLCLPQLSTATSSHLLWIHETGLCTEVSQCHQATLQM